MKCEDPGIPNYGYRIRDDGHFTDTVVLYSCNPGYAMHGSSTLTCLSGDRRVWDKPMPSCVGELVTLGQTLIKNQSKEFKLYVAWYKFLGKGRDLTMFVYMQMTSQGRHSKIYPSCQGLELRFIQFHHNLLLESRSLLGLLHKILCEE